MPSNPTSRTDLLLPGVHRAMGGALQTVLTQAAEAPLFDAERTEERFIDRLLPDGAPSSWLRWLFYAMGADAYWREDYDETRRRLILRRLFELYRSRGTVDGLGLHLSLLADQTLLQATQPPALAFAGVSLTPTERAAFEARHPEIRIWPFQYAGLAQTAMLGRCWPGGATPETKGRGVPAITDAITRAGDRLEWYDPLPVADRPPGAFGADGAGVGRDSAGVFEIRIRGRAVGLCLGRPLVGCTVDHGAARRLYRVLPDSVGGRNPLAVPPTLTPMRVTTDELRIPGTGPGVFLRNRYTDSYPDRGGSVVTGHLVARHAEQRIGRRLRIFDAARAQNSRRAGHGFLGAGPLGALPPHHLVAQVRMSGVMGRGVVRLGGALGGAPAISDAAARVARGRWAGMLARRAGCRVWVDVTTTETICTGGGTMTGAHRAGAVIGVRRA